MTDCLQLTFNSHIPSKKNNRRHVYSKGRRIVISSKAHEAWEKAELATLVAAPKFSGPVSIEYDFYPGTMQLFDLSNAVESINDLLVRAEIIKDDSWLYVRSMAPRLAAFDRGNEHCVVTIKAVEQPALDEALAVLRDELQVKRLAAERKTTQKAIRAHYERIAREVAA